MQGCGQGLRLWTPAHGVPKWSQPERMLPGCLSYPDLIELGVSPRRIRTMARAGTWQAVRRGVYAETDPDSPAVLLAAAALAIKRQWVASHGTAARLHGLTLLRPAESARLIVTTPAGTATHRDLPAVHFHRAALPTAHCTVVDGFPVTTCARTLIDLARRLPRLDGLAALDAALYACRVTPEELGQVVVDCRRWPGVRRAGALVDLSDPACESPLESLSRLFFVAHGIPMPQSQVTLTHRGRFLARSDFWWAAVRVVGEADGLAKYAEPAVLRAEKLRQEALEQTGIRVVRWTWDDIYRPGPARYTAIRLRRALGLPT